MTPANRPDREIVRRIINEQAAAHFVSADLIINSSSNHRAAAARAEAIRKILAETGCSSAGLADVWGCSAETVRAAQRPKPERPPPYDANTRQRLAWAHGETTAASIIAGSDAPTLADVTAWRSLGASA